MSRERALLPLARQLRRRIGRHVPLIGRGVPIEQYQAAQRDSDEAVALAKYLIQQLDDRHVAVCFAQQVGMPGYINLR